MKICGLRDAEAARVAVMSGADALGFILAPSRRQVSPEHVRSVRESLKQGFDTLPPMVGVVVNAGAGQISHDVDVSGIDMIQLSGDESPDLLDEIDVPVIKALRFATGTSVDVARKEVASWLDRLRPARWVLVEGHAEGSYGGTGTRADWALAAELAAEFPVWLAGGLHPDNVGEAIAAVRPFGVDVSSGIETGGAKDHAKIETFVSRVQRSLSSAS